MIVPDLPPISLIEKGDGFIAMEHPSGPVQVVYSKDDFLVTVQETARKFKSITHSSIAVEVKPNEKIGVDRYEGTLPAWNGACEVRYYFRLNRLYYVTIYFARQPSPEATAAIEAFISEFIRLNHSQNDE